MKKISVVIIILGLTVSLLNLANAGSRKGMGGECGNCVQNSAGDASDPLRKFQADTIDLRQEMMTKRFEMQRENLKGTPDEAKIAMLKREIKTIQLKLMDLRVRSGLPTDKCDGECYTSVGDCSKGKGGCNGPCGNK